MVAFITRIDITIIDKLEKDNVFAGFLSRITNNSDDSPIEDSFPDKNLFAISTHTLWHAKIDNYLATRKLPHHLSPREW